MTTTDMSFVDPGSLTRPGPMGRLARLAFGALWAASAPIPERRLLGRAPARPSGAYQSSAEAPVAVSAFKPGFQGWPLIRH